MITRREIALALLVLGFGFALLYWATEPRRQERCLFACYRNLSQIGVALQQYAQDYDDTYPRAWYGPDSGPSDARMRFKWMDAIFPYIKRTEIFTCPSDSTNKAY